MSKAWHRLKTYLRRDFREIINPTSLPNPPEYVPPGKVTWNETWQVHARKLMQAFTARQLLVGRCHFMSVLCWTSSAVKHHNGAQDIQGTNKKYWRTWQPIQETHEGNELEKEKQDSSLKDELCKCAIPESSQQKLAIW